MNGSCGNAGWVRQAAFLGGALCVATLCAAFGLLDHAFAQGSPFGVPRPTSSPPPGADGLVGWILARQAEFYRQMSTALRTAKQDGSALQVLFGVSFLYGVFHAAGPGHGKAVISAYLVANDETWRRGVVLSFASSMLQAVVAVVLVGVAAIVFRATSRAMCDTERLIEIASYGLIAFLGARLTWQKGRSFAGALLGPRARPMPLGADVTHATGHAHAHGHHQGHHHDHDYHHHHRDDHHHHHHHDHADGACAHCGHTHGPEPKDLAGPGGWQRGLSAIVAVGLRPCSGAILVLVFALAQGLFWAGTVAVFLMALGTFITVASIALMTVGAKAFAARLAGSGSGVGVLALRGVELGAAVVVLAFGSLLLLGYLAAERVNCL